MGLFAQVANALLGPPLTSDEETEERVGVLSGVPMLGLDALGSAAYGPEAALTILLPLGVVSLVWIVPISGVILALLAILYLSYRQTMGAYPNGGGSYTVAKENLGIRAGLLAAAALSLDYILNVAVGISSGVGAVISAVPALHRYVLALCLALLGLLTLVNLRGTRASGIAWSIPTYLFVISLGGVLLLGIVRAIWAGGHPVPVVAPPSLPRATAAASVWLLLRAFASGCTAMTGVEAVSNGITAFAEPRTRRAQQTLSVIVGILGLLLAAIACLARAYHVGATAPDKPSYQSVLSQLIGAIVGRGAIYYVTIVSILAVLALSANTSFADFPRLCRLLAEDDFLPHSLANRGRRLVYSAGIAVLAGLSAALIVMFGGITDRLIPLFAVGAFLAFTLSQAGMVVHWHRILRGVGKEQAAATRGRPGAARASLAINSLGAVATGAALCVILAAKFTEGAWISAVLVGSMLLLFWRVKQHYEHVRQETKLERPLTLDGLQPPIVVIPMVSWSTVTEKALRFAYALTLSPRMEVVHVSTNHDDAAEIRAKWSQFVEPPIRAARLPMPRLVILPSPYRQLVTPLLRYVDWLKTENPDRFVAVLVPELVELRWYYRLLHNQMATLLKAALLFRGGRRVVVLNVPWYLRPQETEAAPAAEQRKAA